MPDKMVEMRRLGADWWNDSCDPSQLKEAVAKGATGATSNPVIVETVVSENQDQWAPIVRHLAQIHPQDSSEEITWRLIAEIGRQAAEILEPVYNATNGKNGFLSLQVNPEYNLDPRKMFRQAIELASIAPNIAIKLPTTSSGLETAEKLLERGISINTTISFSVAQAVAAADAIERGLKTYSRNGNDASKIHPYVTIMIGRVGDHLSRIASRDNIEIEHENAITLAGIFVFKEAARLFKERGYRATLLAAAYRDELQWSQIIGKEVLQSIPYVWWKKFSKSERRLRETLWEAEDNSTLQSLQRQFPDFDKIYLENGMATDAFQSFEASAHTLDQFTQGYQGLLAWVDRRIQS